jgi:hypothetical protein
MKRILLQLALLSLGLWTATAQIGQFTTSADIGNPTIKGSSTYEGESQTYTLKGGGYNIWFNHDEFQFLYRKIKGDFLLTANFQLVGSEQGNGHRKTGWMIRETTDHDAVSVNSCLHGDGLVVLQWRLMRGAYMRDPEEELFFPKPYFGESIIQVERISKCITMRIAHPGEPLEEMGSITLPELKDEVLVGPYVLAHDTNSVQEARVWNVRISTPVPPDWHPNRQVKTISHEGIVLGSRLELLDVATGKRKVIQESSEKIGPPRFAKDGRDVWFEQAGRSYSLPVSGGKPEAITIEISKDQPESDGRHVYFSDGKTGTRQIWRNKMDGSQPEQLTFELDHASFPHVSPDGKWVAYLAFPHDANPAQPVQYQRVSLKIMPTAGGAPKTVAFFYGGKGSLENPCWSPDSSSIVFVSSSEKR